MDQPGARRALGGALAPLQGFAFVSDAYLGHRNLAANVASSLLLGLALSLCGAGLRRTRRAAATPPAFFDPGRT